MSIAVITGASSGLGVCYIDAITKLFSEIDELWLITRREERLRKVAEKYPDKHTVIIPMDMTDMNSFKMLEEKLKVNHPRIEVLINDAGMSIGSTKVQSRLPVIDPKTAALKSLKAAKKGRAVYTTAFYKCYRLLAKLIPHILLVKFTGLG